MRSEELPNYYHGLNQWNQSSFSWWQTPWKTQKILYLHSQEPIEGTTSSCPYRTPKACCYPSHEQTCPRKIGFGPHKSLYQETTKQPFQAWPYASCRPCRDNVQRVNSKNDSWQLFSDTSSQPTTPPTITNATETNTDASIKYIVIFSTTHNANRWVPAVHCFAIALQFVSFYSTTIHNDHIKILSYDCILLVFWSW